MRLFISYRSLDSAKVDTIVSRLRSQKGTSDELLYEKVWQDKDCILVGQDWWNAIVDAIGDCDVFIYMISHESAKNSNCRAELSYAVKRNRPIIPVILEGEFRYNQITGKNDIAFWDDIPREIVSRRLQFLFYEGVSFFQKLDEAISELMRHPWKDQPALYPPDPRNAYDEASESILIYDQACDLAYRSEFYGAEELFKRLTKQKDPVFGEDARQWLLLIREYAKIANIYESSHTHYKFSDLWRDYKKQFPKPFARFFDPKDLERKRQDEEHNNLLKAILGKPKQLPIRQKKRSLDDLVNDISEILGEQFELCLVPSGRLSNRTYKLFMPPFSIGKYPITYRQYQVFVDAEDGFADDRWWDGFGIDDSHRSQPGNQHWKIDDHPRENVSWYDALAFCRWLSYRLDEDFDINNIKNWGVRLPNRKEWLKATRGFGKRELPWRGQFDKTRCNTIGSGIGRTTPVTQYPKSASPYGVMDMIGNVWEWCLSERYYDIGTHEFKYNFVAVGGAWDSMNPNVLSELQIDSKSRSNNIGFRIVCPL